MSCENLLRRTLGHAAKAGLAARQPHPGSLRQPERIVPIHEKVEHHGAADDCDGAGTHAGIVASLCKTAAGWIPQERPVIFGIGRNRGDLPSEDDSLAQRRVRLIFLGLPAMYDQVGAIERGRENRMSASNFSS